MIQDNLIYKLIDGKKCVEELSLGKYEENRSDLCGVFICLKGKVRFVLDDVNCLLSKNDMVVYFPYAVVKSVSVSDDIYGIMMSIDINAVQPLIAKIADFDSVLSIRNHPLVRLSEDNLEWIKRYIDLYHKHLEIANQFDKNEQLRFLQLNKLQMENVKLNLVLQIIMAYANIDGKLKNTVDRRDDIMRKFFNDLKVHFIEQHEVSFYANQQFISMRYFSSVVKMRTGKTPSQWIASFLLQEAKFYLTESNLTVKEIAEKMNFPNQSYFGKWFKAHVGMGPLEFKKMKDQQ